MRLYGDLAWVWGELTPPNAYENELNTLLEALAALGWSGTSVLELGCGGGFFTATLPEDYCLTLVDRSAEMLKLAAVVSPEATLQQQSMENIHLDRAFDLIIIHDAVMYLESLETLRITLEHCVRHLSTAGMLVVIPDFLAEDAEDHRVSGGTPRCWLHEWHWCQETDTDAVRINVELCVQIHCDTHIETHSENHQMMAFSARQWFEMFQALGLSSELCLPPWTYGGECFLLRKVDHPAKS